MFGQYGLAKGGILLNNYYVNPVCSPTRASLMSGRSVIHHGVFTPYGTGDDASGLNLTYTLLPEHLKVTLHAEPRPLPLTHCPHLPTPAPRGRNRMATPHTWSASGTSA